MELAEPFPALGPGVRVAAYPGGLPKHAIRPLAGDPGWRCYAESGEILRMRGGRQPLLVRISQYAKREDRLTEAFAAILERVPGLAWRLACVWTDPSAK